MSERVIRKWGHYIVLAEGRYVGFSWKVKKLVLYPQCRTSYQKHKYRNEFWVFEDGKVNIIEVGHWHQLINDTDKKMVVFELQWGKKCIESDIERKEI